MASLWPLPVLSPSGCWFVLLVAYLQVRRGGAGKVVTARCFILHIVLGPNHRACFGGCRLTFASCRRRLRGGAEVREGLDSGLNYFNRMRNVSEIRRLIWTGRQANVLPMKVVNITHTLRVHRGCAHRIYDSAAEAHCRTSLSVGACICIIKNLLNMQSLTELALHNHLQRP